MNKKHWFTLYLDSDVPDTKIVELVHESYLLIARKLAKSKRKELGLP